MLTIVTIHTEPPVEFYKADAAIPFLTGLHHRRLTGLEPLRRPVGGSISASENSNVVIYLDNSDGMLSRLWMVPPLRCRVTLDTVADGARSTLFSGTVSGVSLGSILKLDIEA